MDNAAFACVVVGDTVILICDFFSCPISGSGNRRLALATADDFML
jgi:hypothetical protein